MTLAFKLSIVGKALSVLFFFLAFMNMTHAQTVSQLQSEVDALKQEIATLKSDTPASSTNSRLNARLNALEAALADSQDKISNRTIVHAFESIKLDIGGFLHSAYTFIDTEEESVGSFNRQNFELLIGAEISESWSAFVAGGFLRESSDPFSVGSRTVPEFDNKSKNPLIIGWANYQMNDLINVRVGRMITPHGVINIEHFPATLYEPEQPQFLRPFDGNTIFPNFSTGLQLHGEYFGEYVSMEYATYVANATSSDNTQANIEELFGGRAALGVLDNRIKAGFNFSDGYRSSTDSYYTMFGGDLSATLWLFELKSEYYLTDEETGGDREAMYVQPIVNVTEQWSVYYRYDFLDAGFVIGESIEHVVGINYTPKYNIRLRANYTYKEFIDGFTDNSFTSPLDDEEAHIIQFSGTFSF